MNVSSARISQAYKVVLQCIVEVSELPDWTTNYERGSLHEALWLLNAYEIERAIHALGDGCEHAYRDGYAEDRPEARACKKAFDILTGKEGGAA